jgi:hypothetical protein
MSDKLFKNRLGLTAASYLSEKDNKKLSSLASNSPDRNLLWIANNLVQPNVQQQAGRTTRDGSPIPEDADISKIFKAASNSVRDARNILKSSPELCMGIDIYIAGLLSPNDISEPDLNIICPVSIEVDSIKSQMLDVIKKWAKEEYKIDERLKNWIYRAKFLAGAVPLAIVPLTEIDDIINESDKSKKKTALESYDSDTHFENNFYKPTGLLGPGRHSKLKGTSKRSVFQTLKMESVDNDQSGLYSNRVVISNEEISKLKANENIKGSEIIQALENVFIHDNVEVFKLPLITQAAARRSVAKRYSPLHRLAAMEDGNTETKQNPASSKRLQLENGGELVYPNRHFSLTEVVNVKSRDIYDNFGHPLVIELPYDSAVPITPPGLPENHLLYVIPLDSAGNPLTAPEEDEYHPDSVDLGLQTSSGILGTQMLSQLGDASVDGLSNLRQGVVQNASQRLFNSFLEADLKERLKNGLYSGLELDVKLTGVFAEMMWKRSLAGMQTQFLIIPTELLTYIAFEYNEYGLGESKLSKHKNLAVIASTVQVANALAAINNAIQHKKVTIAFDDDELDAFDTSEKIQQHIVRSQHANALFSSSNTQDQLNHILNSGFHFMYENGNGNFPGTSVDIEYLNREAALIDNDYMDGINRRLIMLSGVSPEIVDMSQEVEFAQTYITGHMLRAQQATVEQKMFCKNLTKFIQSFSLNSAIIIQELVRVVEKARKANDGPLTKTKTSTADLIEEFIESIETSLPKPDTTKLKAQMENLDSHEQFIDKVIEYHFNDPMFASDEVGEKVGGKLEFLKASWKSSYMRGILQNNNLIPDHFNFMYGDLDQEDRVDPLTEAETLVKRTVDYALEHEAVMSKIRYSTDAKIEHLNERDMNSAGSEGGDNDTSSPTPEPAPESTDDGGEGGGKETPAAEPQGDGGEDLFGGGDDGEFGFESADHRPNRKK